MIAAERRSGMAMRPRPARQRKAAGQDVLQRLFGLQGKTALVTGAAGGIGRALAKGLAEAGAAVALADLDEEAAEEAATDLAGRGLSTVAARVDLADVRSITRMVGGVVRKLGKVDILVNCAAINRRQPVIDVEPATFDRIVAVNLRGLYQVSQQVAAHMIARGGGGKIIHIGSVNSRVGLAGVSVYGATKGAISQVTMVMAVEWARHDIQVNCIAPGFIRTPLIAPLLQDRAKARWIRSRIAMERPGEPAELLGTALLLASPASSYITGQTFYVDGGMLAGGRGW
jgi:NAD(P)-dependent dehydrogenase (short-subunit alcohol dehydrogenase family)